VISTLPSLRSRPHCLPVRSQAFVLNQSIRATLPLVGQGLIQFELIPLRAYAGFARLFAPAD
jgi:hypothetical protein